MRKIIVSLFVLWIGLTAYGQQKIQLRSVDKAECVSSDMNSMKASFSFSGIEANDVANNRGTFSWLSMPNTVLGGNVGEPQVPVINELIAVPFGATPRIEITSYSATDYSLEDFGMHTLVPRQLPVRKNQNPEEMPFVMNESAYQTRGLRSEPQSTVSVEGMMRGVQLGTMTIEPVSYDPVNNTVRVFNDIEVTVHFDGADAQATKEMLLNTYSPAFEAVYDQLFNNRAVTDVYTQHPDFYNTPVKMLVICYSGFKNNSSLNEWLQWKLQKGYYVDIYYTDETGTTATNIKNFIKTKYNASVSAGNAYTYLIVIGDTGQVPQYMTKTVDESCASDLGYSSVNFTTSSTSNYFPDMYYSRISVENTTHLTNYINKVLTYERYEFADGGNYLNNVILVGGWDKDWTSAVAKPTINYGKNNYFNSSNTTYGGFGSGTIKATVSTSSSAGYSGTNNGVYNGINNGVCFLNYTAHGDKQEWYQPKMTATHVASLTNTGKYFFGVGNCCLTGNFNNTSTTYSPGSAIGTKACFAETMIRVPNAGAVAYIGCSPYSYWYEDFYWAVGAHSYSAGNAPSVSSSSKGVYDVMFADQYWNSASALLYLGNLAVQQAVTNSNTNSGITDGNCNNSAHYYFRFYHTFGDGSVMPYITKPETNTVTLPSTVTPGTTSITVNALAGSYVAVTDNSSVIYGVAEANSSGVATVNFTNAIPSSGTLHVVVTRQQYQPWFGTITVQGGTQYTITATANPSAGGTVTGAGEYYENTQCILTATPNAHYEFSGWTKNGTQVSTANPYTFTVTGNATYVAQFTALTAHTVTCNTVQNGAISASPTTAYKGETVTLTANPNSGYCLSTWSVMDANNNPVQVSNNQFTMPDSDVTVSATFATGYNVTLASVSNGTISASPTYGPAGTTVTLTATPASGYSLDSWIVYRTDDMSTNVSVSGNSFTMPAFDVTVDASFVVMLQNEYVKVTSEPDDWSGEYLIVYEDGEVAFDGGLTTLDASENTISVTISENTIPCNSTTEAAQFTIAKSGNSYTIRSASGYYIGRTSNSNGLESSNSTSYTNSLSYQNGNVNVVGSGGAYLRFNNASNEKRFRYYKSSTYTGQKAIQLYKKGGSNVVVTYTVTFNANGGTGSMEPQVVNELEPTSLTANAFTRENYSFAGWNTAADGSGQQYADQASVSLSDNLTLYAQWVALSSVNYQLVTSASQLVAGKTYLIVNVDNNKALGTTQNNNNRSAADVVIENNVIQSINETVCELTLGGTTGEWTFFDAGYGNNGGYLYAASSTSNQLKTQVTNNANGQWSINIGSNGVATIKAQGTNKRNLLKYNSTSTIFSCYSNGQQDVCLFVRVESSTQAVNLASGWNWWAPMVEISLADLEAALGTNGLAIVAQEGNAPQSLAPGKMFKIQTGAACEFTLNGVPAEVTLSFTNGINWFGHTGVEAAIADALAGITPATGDKIISQDGGFAIFNGSAWEGTLNNLEPGRGYVYVSKASGSKTVTF